MVPSGYPRACPYYYTLCPLNNYDNSEDGNEVKRWA